MEFRRRDEQGEKLVRFVCGSKSVRMSEGERGERERERELSVGASVGASVSVSVSVYEGCVSVRKNRIREDCIMYFVQGELWFTCGKLVEGFLLFGFSKGVGRLGGY